MDDLSTRISIVVKESGLTKTDFGKKVNLSQPTITKLMNGTQNPSERTLIDIADKFQVNEDWLRTGEGNMTRDEDQDNAMMQWVGSVLSEEPTSIRRRFLYLLKHMTPEDWERAEQYAHFLLGDPINPTDTQK